MSIPRHAASEIAFGYMGDPDDPAYQIIYVTERDHLAEKAISYADGRVDGMKDVADLCYNRGVQAERERIVEAVKALMSPPSDRDPTPFDFFIYEEVLPIIEGSDK